MTTDFSASVYVDTSVLVALFGNEATAPTIHKWLAFNKDRNLCSASWCVTEFASAVSVKVRGGSFSELQAERAWQEFEEACNGDIELLSVQEQDFSTAASLCRVGLSAMRAGDALHLAVAMRHRCSLMLSLDRNLNLNAQANDLDVVNL